MIIKHQSWYQCPTCNHRWSDTGDSPYDDDCPNCAERSISPECSEELFFSDENDARQMC